MPVVKVGGGLSGGNSGSSGGAVEYLEKENRIRKKSERSKEAFFNQKSRDITPAFAIKELDSKRRGLRKNEAKYYNLIISPSQKELVELTDDDLKDYTKDLMVKYAENFDRGVDPNDLVWFAKLEKKRKYKGFKQKKNDKLNLPTGVKSGDYKTGDNRHIHVLVRRKTERDKSLSPLANQRKGTTKGAVVGKVGFNRIKFSAAAENVMHEHIKRVNPDYKFKFDDLQVHQFLKNNNNDYEKARQLGFCPAAIDALLNREEERKAEQIGSEVESIFIRVMDTGPGSLKAYQSMLKDSGVELEPIFKEKEEAIDYDLFFKGEKIKLSEIDNTGFYSHMLSVVIKDDKDKKIRKGVVLELRGIFDQAMSKNPKNVNEYGLILKDLGVEAKSIIDEHDKASDYEFQFKGLKIKPSEIDDRAITHNILTTLGHNRKDERIRNEVVLELKGIFNQAMSKKPTDLREYQSILRGLGVKIEPVENEDGKKTDYEFLHKGLKIKPSEIEERAVQHNLVTIVKGNRKSKQTLTSAEKIKRVVDFHKKENYRGKLRNPSFSYINNALVNAVESKHGFKLTKEELQASAREIKLNNPRKGLSP